MKLKNKNQTGFTLIELLVVIAIIGLLAGVITIALSNARVKGRDAKRVGDVRQLITAMDQYYIAHGSYPTGTGSVGASGTALDDPTSMDMALEPMIPNYIPIFPVAPNPSDGGCAGSVARNSNNYWYDSAIDGSTYTITFCLGKDAGSWFSGIRTASPSGVQ